LELSGEGGRAIRADDRGDQKIGGRSLRHAERYLVEHLFAAKTSRGCDEKMYVFVLSLKLRLPLDKNEARIQTIGKDLLNELRELWDNLPIDTVIASLLDPRTKFLDKLPKAEVKEALEILKKVCSLSRFYC
jgi:hypothetical protein